MKARESATVKFSTTACDSQVVKYEWEWDRSLVEEEQWQQAKAVYSFEVYTVPSLSGLNRLSPSRKLLEG